MVQLELQNEEAETLLGVLHHYLSDLRMEVADTEAYEYQIALKQRVALLQSLISNLETKVESRSEA